MLKSFTVAVRVNIKLQMRANFGKIHKSGKNISPNFTQKFSTAQSSPEKSEDEVKRKMAPVLQSSQPWVEK